VEQEQDSAGVSRGQNQLHVLPEDWQTAASVIEPLLDRVDEEAAPQLIVVTNDSEAAASIAGQIAPTVTRRGLRILAATDARRAGRVLRASPAQVIAAPATVLLELLQSTVLKLEGVRAVVLAWVDELDGKGTRALETVMSELPKDAARMIVANAVTPAVEQLIERYGRRARRVQPVSAESLAPAAVSYVAVNESARLPALRRILDALDPESAFVVARTPESRAAVDALLHALGYGAGSDAVRVGETPDADATLVVLFDLPATEHELRRLVGERASARAVAMVTPRQISTLRRFAGGMISPLVLPEAAARARTREDSLRDELRALLMTGQYSRELVALEPLLSEFDGAEVAAAALRLLESERAKAQTSGPTTQPALTRLYMNVGSMDNVRPGDLVGAITNEAGISKAELGKVDVRERHSTVEVATAVANTVVSKLTGVTIRGRRVVARVDEERARDRTGTRRDDVRLGSREGRRDRGGPGGPGGPSRERGGRPPRDRTRRDDRPRPDE
jgi:ATP-dependent RNA helicase DeaD